MDITKSSSPAKWNPLSTVVKKIRHPLYFFLLSFSFLSGRSLEVIYVFEVTLSVAQSSIKSNGRPQGQVDEDDREECWFDDIQDFRRHYHQKNEHVPPLLLILSALKLFPESSRSASPSLLRRQLSSRLGPTDYCAGVDHFHEENKR